VKEKKNFQAPDNLEEVGEQLKLLEQQILGKDLSLNNEINERASPRDNKNLHGEDGQRDIQRQHAAVNQTQLETDCRTDVSRQLEEEGHQMQSNQENSVNSVTTQNGQQGICYSSDQNVHSKMGAISLNPPFIKDEGISFSEKQLVESELCEDRTESVNEDLAPGRG
jgi:hypothetical protein